MIYTQNYLMNKAALFLENYILPESSFQIPSRKYRGFSVADLGATNDKKVDEQIEKKRQKIEKEHINQTINRLRQGRVCFGLAFKWLYHMHMQFNPPKTEGKVDNKVDNMDDWEHLAGLLVKLDKDGFLQPEGRALQDFEVKALDRFINSVLFHHYRGAVLFDEPQVNVNKVFSDTQDRSMRQEKVTGECTFLQVASIIRQILQTQEGDTMMLVHNYRHTIGMYIRKKSNSYKFYIYDPDMGVRSFCYRRPLTGIGQVVAQLFSINGYRLKVNDPTTWPTKGRRKHHTIPTCFHALNFQPSAKAGSKISQKIDAAKILRVAGVKNRHRGCYFAVRSGDIASLKYYLDLGADPTADFFSVSLLGWAVRWGSKECLEELMQRGADPFRSVKRYMDNPIQMAIKEGRSVILKTIIRQVKQHRPNRFVECIDTILSQTAWGFDKENPGFFRSLLDTIAEIAPENLGAALMRLLDTIINKPKTAVRRAGKVYKCDLHQTLNVFMKILLQEKDAGRVAVSDYREAVNKVLPILIKNNKLDEAIDLLSDKNLDLDRYRGEVESLVKLKVSQILSDKGSNKSQCSFFNKKWRDGEVSKPPASLVGKKIVECDRCF